MRKFYVIIIVSALLYPWISGIYRYYEWWVDGVVRYGWNFNAEVK